MCTRCRDLKRDWFVYIQDLFPPFELVFVVCCSLSLLMMVLNYLCLALKDSFPFELWLFCPAASCGTLGRFSLGWTRMEMGSWNCTRWGNLQNHGMAFCTLQSLEVMGVIWKPFWIRGWLECTWILGFSHLRQVRAGFQKFFGHLPRCYSFPRSGAIKLIHISRGCRLETWNTRFFLDVTIFTTKFTKAKVARRWRMWSRSSPG